MMDKMFCFQCQEAAEGKGCYKYGVCGKSPDNALMQDFLVYVTKGLACVTTRMRKEKRRVTREINHMITQNLYMTITNTNFDNNSMANRIMKTERQKNFLLSGLKKTSGLPEAAFWNVKDGTNINIRGMGVPRETDDKDMRSLRELVTYGLKGLAAYMTHANALGAEEDQIDVFIQKALSKTLDDSLRVDELLELALETGRFGVRGMSLLDKANCDRYGSPEISAVPFGVCANPGILVSGHDLRDLEMLLEQTAGKGVDVYTHSEMLSAHYYPKFKSYPNLVGNYGGSWQNQRNDFSGFNGPILMTSNCLIPPGKDYKRRLWTTGPVGYHGCRHISGACGEFKDFSPIIEQAKACKPPDGIDGGIVTGGFGHHQLTRLYDKIVDGIKSGTIRKLVVMAGCDGRMQTREYYTEFANRLPRDIVILTAGCGKYRFIRGKFGDIDGIPRMIDAGQCNDTYSLMIFFLNLKKRLDIDSISDLPIAYNISWYEQKAVIVLLALLSLGVKDIRLGPSLPAFLSTGIADRLHKDFGLSGIETVNEDLRPFFD